VLSDVLFNLFLELDLIPMKIQGDQSVHRIPKLWSQQQGVNTVNNVLATRLWGPVPIEDTVTNLLFVSYVSLCRGCLVGHLPFRGD
jgi:hypothetical protein